MPCISARIMKIEWSDWHIDHNKKWKKRKLFLYETLSPNYYQKWNKDFLIINGFIKRGHPKFSSILITWFNLLFSKCLSILLYVCIYCIIMQINEKLRKLIDHQQNKLEMNWNAFRLNLEETKRTIKDFKTISKKQSKLKIVYFSTCIVFVFE